jgi:hypothetical protein
MKLACKRYGEAWNSGSRSALRSAVTSDFAAQWARLPQSNFATMPRGGAGQVISTSKGRGVGTVTVSTSQGVLTFVVVGGGFQWTVADIHKAGDDGRTVSLKEYLDVTMTAREFITDLKNRGGTSFHESITRDFQHAFADLTPSALQRIQDFLPDPHQNVKPYVQIGDQAATMRVQIPNRGPNDFVTFRLKRESGWRVDDYTIDSDAIKVASFRSALPTIAAVTGFRQFARDPEGNDPVTFTGPGELRTLLQTLRAERPFPLKANGDARLLVVADDGKSAQVTFPNRVVHISMAPAEKGQAIDRIWVMTGDRWADFAHLMTLQRSLQKASMFAFLRRTPAVGAARVALTEGLAPASTSRIEEPVPTTQQPIVTEATAAVVPESAAPAPQASPAPASLASNAASIDAVAATPAAAPAAPAVAPPTGPIIQRVSYSAPTGGRVDRRAYRRARRR